MNADERRFVVPGLYIAGSLSAQGAGLRQGRLESGRGLGSGERGAQVGCV
jgi:hypothetical protein